MDGIFGIPLIFFLLAALYLFYKFGFLLKYLIQFLTTKLETHRFQNSKKTVADFFQYRVDKSPNKSAIEFEGRVYTYSDVDRLSSLVSLWALNLSQTHSIQLPVRSTVCLMMENRPEFIFIWLGLAKLGIITALLNTHLTGESLIHAINAAQGSLLIVGSECLDKINDENFLNKIKNIGVNLFIVKDNNINKTNIKDTNTNHNHNNHNLNGSNSFEDISYIFDDENNNNNNVIMLQNKYTDFKKLRRNDLTSLDVLFYIYTSGTTGLPKAARIKHIRFFLGACSFSVFNYINGNDRIYTCMPLYHSAAGIIGVGMAWYTGATLVLRRKFSASAFFKDCTNFNVTVIQYIGELARYLLATPLSTYDTSHKVARAIGNGMSKEVWIDFQKRFNIGYVGEFYASTEGNCNLLNNQNKVGAMGFIPFFASFFYPVKIVQFDYELEQPKRNKNGHLIECEDGEAGELIGKIESKDPLRSFDGYTSSTSSNDKIISNAFKPHDQWFRTGDLVMRDAEGFVYFKDRIGDTFRWKGENVATTEVSALLSKHPRVSEINVYGVKVPNNDGRAGMCSIVLKPSSDTSNLSDSESPESNPNHNNLQLPLDFYSFVRKVCAPFMQPLFIRIQASMEVTATFKQRKVDLVKEGFDPAAVGSDVIYFKDDQAKAYVRVTKELYNQLQQGLIRV